MVGWDTHAFMNGRSSIFDTQALNCQGSPSFEERLRKKNPKPKEILSLLNNKTSHAECGRVRTLELNCLNSNTIPTSHEAV